ncbi:MAG: flagellar basal body-associated FliL family protein [Rickettsiales bacterium]|nr:flagellar basal body-associated FliL family protein [Pseudomonadota bacterium]MDA0965497.1 flagellar basal body-associated FliL family protein [Pseudomonadota bacterium]MDG4542821.1 flagellar basal body-associated FliL family protein [Rickettsiales bacterium]MDG4544731.1 flagellar basal body-associated FliL family protein [Rickettsiales bacterium]MDG4546853.1 flagellar basal body-associated FliL family protein [Rickettsiales bacterium]
MAEEEKNIEEKKDEDTSENEAEEAKGEGEEDGGEGEEGGEKKKKKKGGKLKLIIIVLVLLLAGGGGAAAYFMGFFNKKIEVSSGEIREGEEVVGEDGVIEKTVFYDMEEFIANLNVGSKRPSFLKMTVSLELAGESQIPMVESKMPRIRDSFQVYLRELRQEDLQGSAGLYRLREELLLRINKIVYPAKINDILFKEILVQ